MPDAGDAPHLRPLRTPPTNVAVQDRPASPPIRSVWTALVASPIPRRRRINPWLVAALGAAVASFVVNEIGVNFGLPYHLHWDEPIIVNRAIRMGGGDLNPHYFDYPSLLMYAVLVAESGLYLLGRLLHWFHSPQSFAFYYLTDSTAVFVVGRTLIASIGAAATFLTYTVGRRFFSPGVGLLAAMIVAVSPAFVGSAHFVTTDVPMAFFVLLAYRFIWDVYSEGGRRSYVLAGIAIGLGIATKYLPAILFLTLGAAHVLRIRLRTGRWLPFNDLRLPALSLAAAAIAFFVASPFSILDVRTAIHDYSATAAIAAAGGCGACRPNFVPFLTHDLAWASGWPVYVLSVTGLASIALVRRERRMRYLVLASFPILLFAVTGVGRNAFARYLVPLAPFMAMAAAAQAFWLVSWVRKRTASTAPQARLAPALIVPLAGALVMPALLSSVSFDQLLTQPDSRVRAVQWFEANVPAGTTVSVQPVINRFVLNAPIMTDTQLATIEGYVPPSMPSLKYRIDNYYASRPLYHNVPFVYDLDRLRSEGAVYVVISSATYHVPGDDRFFASLTRQASLVARFTAAMTFPDDKLFPVGSPTISIYGVNPSG